MTDQPGVSGETATSGHARTLLAFTATTFLSALLLFSIQPMFARMVLPLLGGTPAVWNTCRRCAPSVVKGLLGNAATTVGSLNPSPAPSMLTTVMVAACVDEPASRASVESRRV